MADLEEIKKMYSGGMTIQAIAEEVGKSTSYITKLLSAMGLSGSVKRTTVISRLTPEQTSDAIEMYLRGDPVAAIILKLDLNYNAFYRLLKDNNIEMRDRSLEAKSARSERLDLAVKLYEKGVIINQIEIETGVRQPILHRELLRRGVPMRRARPISSSARAVLDEETFDISDLTEHERALLLPEADDIPTPKAVAARALKERQAREEQEAVEEQRLQAVTSTGQGVLAPEKGGTGETV